MSNKNQKGVTIVELVIAISIIAIALFGILSVFRLSVTNSANTVTKKQAVLISESLMEEVLSKPFTKPDGGYTGPFTVANRDKFDSVTDYNNLNITSMATIGGVIIVGLEKYSAVITTATNALGSVPASDSILVTINVTGPNDTFVLKGYRINYDN